MSGGARTQDAGPASFWICKPVVNFQTRLRYYLFGAYPKTYALIHELTEADTPSVSGERGVHFCLGK